MSKITSLFSLDGKVIVITGGAGFLGRKHAEAIAAFGGKPVILDLNKKKVQDAVQDLNIKFPKSSIGYTVDITNENQILKNSEKIISRYGKIDGLINNASNNPKVEENSEIEFSRLENFPLDLWQHDINVGLTGAFLCTKIYGTKIAKNENGGVIVNISSDLGIISPDQRLYKKEELCESNQPVKPITYSVAKAGIIGLTKYTSTYWAEKNVRCNVICPGGVENGQPTNFIKALTSKIPLNRLASPDEYQGTIIWILSDAASYVNGATISIDGGRTVW
tara:strand:+ start:339 stop:1172 length:834 start_codon:yes stop_codon:yes gene_type:complete